MPAWGDMELKDCEICGQRKMMYARQKYCWGCSGKNEKVKKHRLYMKNKEKEVKKNEIND